MNIDFHYGVIYAVSRLAGLAQNQAEVVAHACQYVDDASTNGILKFVDGESYERFASAHELFDYKNLNNDQNRVIWAPFHFLPGGDGNTLEEKAICKPNSNIAKEMMRRAIDGRPAENGLHRLGISLHVYVDTWAHQGFSGISSKHNAVVTLSGEDYDHNSWSQKFTEHLSAVGETLEARALSKISGLGHGAALHFPDMPWAKWRYTNGAGVTTERDNLPEFIAAADMACKAVQGYINANSDYDSQPGLSENAKRDLTTMLGSVRDHEGDVRLGKFCQAIADGKLDGLKEIVPGYIPKGVGSWKHIATGITDVGDGSELPKWTQSFESSDYRKFHDAIKQHRFVITQVILPKHGLRLA